MSSLVALSNFKMFWNKYNEASFADGSSIFNPLTPSNDSSLTTNDSTISFTVSDSKYLDTFVNLEGFPTEITLPVSKS